MSIWASVYADQSHGRKLMLHSPLRRKKSRKSDRPVEEEQPQEEDNGLPQMSEQEREWL